MVEDLNVADLFNDHGIWIRTERCESISKSFNSDVLYHKSIVNPELVKSVLRPSPHEGPVSHRVVPDRES